MLAKHQFWLFNQITAYVIAGMVAAVFLLYCCYSVVLLRFYPHRYRGIRFTSRTMAYISLISATNAAITIAISLYFPITVLPPFRLLFEMIMIRVCGLLLGPVAGVLSALATEAIVLFFIPSYVHIAFTMAVVASALIAGLVSISCPRQRKHRLWFLLVLSVVIAGFGALVLVYTRAFGLQHQDRIQIFHGLYLYTTTSEWLLGVIFGLFLAAIWGAEAYSYFFKSCKLHGELLVKILVVSILAEFVSNTFLISWGENSLLSSRGFGVLVIYHLLQAPIQVLFYLPVVYTVTWIVRPLVKHHLIQ